MACCFHGKLYNNELSWTIFLEGTSEHFEQRGLLLKRGLQVTTPAKATLRK